MRCNILYRRKASKAYKSYWADRLPSNIECSGVFDIIGVDAEESEWEKYSCFQDVEKLKLKLADLQRESEDYEYKQGKIRYDIDELTSGVDLEPDTYLYLQQFVRRAYGNKKNDPTLITDNNLDRGLYSEIFFKEDQ